MDRLRYFGNEVGFDTRKHYVDRWLAMDPGPMTAVSLPEDLVTELTVELSLDGLPALRGYPCPLWRSNFRSVSFQAIPQDMVHAAVSRLESGFYVLFGVASPRYLELYGEHSGPMGQVHPALLEVTETEVRVHHASTAKEEVVTVPLDAWLTGNQRLHRASTIYALDPTWDPQRRALTIEESDRCMVH